MPALDFNELLVSHKKCRHRAVQSVRASALSGLRPSYSRISILSGLYCRRRRDAPLSTVAYV